MDNLTGKDTLPISEERLHAMIKGAYKIITLLKELI